MNLQNFTIKEKTIGGETCKLITPSLMGDIWDKNNLFYRSIILNSNDKPISVGWPKFFNYTESPELYPDPNNFDDWVFTEKLDGSLIIISKYKGEPIVRTRGVFSAFEHETGDELTQLLSRNEKILNNKWVDSENYSLLFEHITPNNQIVLKYDNPELILIGGVRHSDLRCLTNKEIDNIHLKLGVNRSKVYRFDSLNDIIEHCIVLKDFEGYVLSYNNDQNRIKFKTTDYLLKHSFKSNVTPKNILNSYFELGQPDYDEFMTYIIHNFDYECWTMAKDIVERVCVAKKVVDSDIKDVMVVVNNKKNLSDKDFALAVKDEQWKSIAFSLRKGKELPDKLIRKMIEENL